MLEWLTDLDGRFLTEAEQPAIRVTHRRRRLVPALIAAAAAVVCMTAGVSASLSRNTDLLTKWFGKDAESSLSALPEPKVYENGQVRVTVETELDDGINHMLLVSIETPDGEPYQAPLYDWQDVEGNPIRLQQSIMTYGYDAVHHGFSSIGQITEFGGFDFRRSPEDHSETPDGTIPEYRLGSYMAIRIPYAQFDEGDFSFKLMFRNMEGTEIDIDDPDDNPFAGISIPVHKGQNTECAVYRAENGNECRLSCFELTVLDRNAANIAELHWDTSGGIVLIKTDGSRKELDWRDTHGAIGEYLEPGIYSEVPLGTFTDTDSVQAVELGGVLYEKQ
jgi:hypothetical protein